MSVNSYWGTEDSEILLLGQAIVWSFISLIFFLWCPFRFEFRNVGSVPVHFLFNQWLKAGVLHPDYI